MFVNFIFVMLFVLIAALPTLDNSVIILSLSLGEVATIGIGTSVLVRERLGGDFLVHYMVNRGIGGGGVRCGGVGGGSSVH